MAGRLLAQGFAFDGETLSTKTSSILPATGRRIRVSSRIMSELLGILLYLKYNSSFTQTLEIFFFFS